MSKLAPRNVFSTINKHSFFVIYLFSWPFLYLLIWEFEDSRTNIIPGFGYGDYTPIIYINILLVIAHIFIAFTNTNTRTRYLSNILLFILFYFGQLIPIAIYSNTYIRQGPTGLVAMSLIICLFTSYFIVKLIRKPKKQNLTSGTINISEELMKLHELKDKGILTEAEFTEQKKKILKQ